MKLLKKFSLGVVLVLIAMQFYNPTKNISPGNHAKTFIKETNPSPELKTIFETTCYDCHSNNTAYPWYNNIAPISYWINSHIKDGKKHLNFSDWQTYSRDKKDHLLEEIEEMVVQKDMPLTEYTYLHDNSKLTDKEVSEIVAWVKQTRIIYQLGKQPK